MRRVVMVLGLCVALGNAWAQQQAQQQQIWRCEVDGQVRYTDRPCEKAGQPLPARALQANVLPAVVAPAASVAASAPAPDASAPALATPELPAAMASAAEIAGDACTGDDGEAACRQEVGRSADSGVAASQAVAVAPPRRAFRPPAEWQRPALHGLLHTSFVQRGYVPRRQNPASTSP